MISSPASGQPPELQIDGAVATLRLRRPAQANRIERADVDILLAQCQQLAALSGTVRALVVTAEGRHFSAGYDIGSVLATLEGGAQYGRAENPFADMVDALEELPQTTICAIQGGVYGGSTDLALACDFRLGVPATRLFMPAARLGLHYYPSGMRRFVSRLGQNVARSLFLLAQELDADQLLAVGYLNEIVPAGELIPRALDIAQRACAMAPLASSGMKAALNMLAHGSFNEKAVLQNELACLRSQDLREGVAAWGDKRVAVFTGS